MSRPIPLHDQSGTLPRSNVRYRVVPMPTLADRLDAFYRERRMIHGSLQESDERPRGPEAARLHGSGNKRMPSTRGV